MNPTPGISVIIPTHNRAALLRECVASVFRQTWVDWEMIIVDDASRDETARVIESVADDRVRSVRNDTPANAAAARNQGARLAAGDILTFLDDDDLYLPEKLERTWHAFQTNAESGVVVSGFDTGALVVSVDWHGDVAGKLAKRFYTLPTSILAVRASVFDRLGGFDDTMTPSEDFEFCIRASRVTKFQSLPQPLVFHRQHSGPRLIDNRMLTEASFTRMVTKNFGDGRGGIGPRGRRLLCSWKGQGHAGRARVSFANGDRRGAQEHSRAALWCEPLNIRRWLQWGLYRVFPSGSWFARWYRRARVRL